MTKLIINDNDKYSIEARELKYGEWFKYKNDVYMRISSVDRDHPDKIKVVDIVDGITALIKKETLIKPIKEVEVNI